MHRVVLPCAARILAIEYIVAAVGGLPAPASKASAPDTAGLNFVLAWGVGGGGLDWHPTSQMELMIMATPHNAAGDIEVFATALRVAASHMSPRVCTDYSR
jgi:hypothetical protein